MLSLLLACTHAPDSKAQPTEPLVDPDGAELLVQPDGTLVLTGTSGAHQEFRLGFGFVGDYEEKRNYDPYLLKDPTWESAAPFVEWATVTTAAKDGDSWRMTLENGEAGRLTVENRGPGFHLGWTQEEGSTYAPFAVIRTTVDEAQRFYGLGETFDAVEKRGTIHAMHMVFDSSLESSYNETHAPVPLLESTDSWGMLVDSFRPGVFDVAASDAGMVEAIFEQKGDFVVDLYAPERPVEVVARYHQRVGTPEIPPTWAFAPLQWRNVAADESVILGDAKAIRDNGVATGLIWVDNPWQSSYNSMVGDPTQFPDWSGMVQSLHDQGFRFMAWSTPYVEDADPDHAKYEANGWFVDAPILFSDFGDAVDFTHPDAMAAWQERVTAAKDAGIEGWKMDYGEDLQIGIGAASTHFGLHSGEDERTMHHQWAGLYHTAYSAPYNGESFILGRAGGLGTQHVTDCIWPGDLDSDFRRFREDGHVGGLPSAIRGGLSLAASGFPFFASDTGGYRHDRPTHEAMVRWTEFSALLPIMQYGGGGENHNPWDYTAYGTSQFTEETLSAFKRYASLHTRLFPYFWELAQRALKQGLPVVAPLGLVEPEAPYPDEEFLIGDDLLVAPVEDEGATTKTVVFPPGTWVHWWTGEAVDGEQTLTVDAPVGAGPLYQRLGSAIPLLRASVMTLSPSDGSVDSWADTPGKLNARVVPGSALSFTLESGEDLNGAGNSLKLTGGSLYSGWELEIWASGVSAVSADGKALNGGSVGCEDCWYAEGPWIHVVLSASSGVVTWQ